MIVPFFDDFWTYHSFDIGKPRLPLPLNRGCYFQPRQPQQVVGYDGATNILFESSPTRPGAPGQPESTLECRNVGLYAGAEIPKLLVDPAAFDHVQDGDSFALGKGNIGNPFLLGLPQVVLRGKAPIRSHLARRPSIQSLLPFEQGQEYCRVCRVTPFDQAVQNQAGASPSHEHLVPVGGLPVPFFDDVRVVLEKGKHLLTGGNLLSFKHPSSGLVHHLIEGLNHLPELFCYPLGADRLQEIRTPELIENPDGFRGISPNPRGDLKQVPVALFAHALLLAVENLERTLLDHPPVIRKAISGSGGAFLPCHQQSGDHPHSVHQKTRIGRVMDVGFHRGGVQPNGSSFLDTLAPCVFQNRPVGRLPGGLAQSLDVLLEGRTARLLPHSQLGKCPKAPRILQVESQFFVCQVPVLLQDGATENLFSRHPRASRLRVLHADQIALNLVKDLGILIDDLGDGLQFLANLVSRDNVEQAHLGISFFTHSGTGLMNDCLKISNCYIIHYAGALPNTQAKIAGLGNLFSELTFPDGH